MACRWTKGLASRKRQRRDGPSYVPRVPRRFGMSTSMPLVNIKRSMVEATFTTTNAWAGAQYSFRLDKLPDYAEFNTVFTQYRINAVKLTLIPMLDGVDANTQINSVTNYVTIPRVYAMVDKDYQPNIASENAFIQHNDLKIIRDPMKSFTIYCAKPAVQQGLQTTASVAYSGLKSGEWISTDSPSVNHFGICVGGIIPFTAGGHGIAYSVVATYYLQFRGNQ